MLNQRFKGEWQRSRGSFKNSLSYLKFVFINGNPQQRKWVCQMLLERWTELDPEWKKVLSIFNPEKAL